jgi:hypothetical protein
VTSPTLLHRKRPTHATRPPPEVWAWIPRDCPPLKTKTKTPMPHIAPNPARPASFLPQIRPMASFNAAGAGAANPNPNKSLEVRARRHSLPLPWSKWPTPSPHYGPTRLMALLPFRAGESGPGGRGLQPQLQPQGQPPHRHLLGQPGLPPAAAAAAVTALRLHIIVSDAIRLFDF